MEEVPVVATSVDGGATSCERLRVRPRRRGALVRGTARSQRPCPRSGDDIRGCDPGLRCPRRSLAWRFRGAYLDRSQIGGSAALYALRGGWLWRRTGRSSGKGEPDGSRQLLVRG